MAFANGHEPHSRMDEDVPDQIGSDRSSPSGILTPQPNPVDKRLPGIAHSYFGQVRARSSTNPSSADPSALVTPALDAGIASYTPVHYRESMREVGALPTAPSSPDGKTSEEHEYPPLLPHERMEKPEQEALQKEDLLAYPTPPISSSSSLSTSKKDEPGANDESGAGSGSGARDAQAKNLPISAMPSKARRHTLTVAAPLSSIITDFNVHAAHISNPTSNGPPTTPPSPNPPAQSNSERSSNSSSFHGLKKLTEGTQMSSRKKSTPPQTPRASSDDPSSAEKPASATTSESAVQEVASSQPNAQQTAAAERSTIPSTSTGTTETTSPVGPPKGKLTVTISEAKGLRPSHDPYVVCVFEWNEYISKGPKNDEMDTSREGSPNDEAPGSVAIRRSGSDGGRPLAIPMKSRQSSNNSLSDSKEFKGGRLVTDPKWDHEAVFDVIGDHSEIDVSVYDNNNQEAFLGHVKFCPNLNEKETVLEGWFKLQSRGHETEHISGEIFLRMKYTKTDKRHYGPEDFQILKLIGKGTFGQVYQVRKKDTQRIYAMKVLSKKVIVQKKEVAHTLGERNILVRTAMADSPFIVGLKFSFQTPTDLYLVTDYMSGGELFWHLQKEGRFQEARAKFYIAELILALQHLHQYDIVYRDLKPENILLDANGHIALCDFGLSKANLTKNDTTNTFCGTTEYLAPEVLLDEQGYTKMVDFWSLGVLVFEMCCGWSPFYAEDTQQMYKNIAFGKVRFPRDALSTEGRNFVKGLLNRNPKHRLGATHDAEELKAHPFFADVDWEALGKKDIVPPFKPKLKSETDTSNFDPEFTNAPAGASLNARAAALAAGNMTASTPLSPGMQANFKGFTFVDESNMDEHFRGHDLERMDEDTTEDNQWHGAPSSQAKREDRMSGVVRTGGGEDSVFNHGNFDI